MIHPCVELGKYLSFFWPWTWFKAHSQFQSAACTIKVPKMPINILWILCSLVDGGIRGERLRYIISCHFLPSSLQKHKLREAGYRLWVYELKFAEELPKVSCQLHPAVIFSYCEKVLCANVASHAPDLAVGKKKMFIFISLWTSSLDLSATVASNIDVFLW